MAEVNLHINGRNYPILCDDGQEERILRLATYIDERVREIAGSGAANSDNHLLVLTSLILTDELFELREGMNTVSEGVSLSGDETAVIETLRSLTTRISMASERVKKL